jgi:hypothetical protein
LLDVTGAARVVPGEAETRLLAKRPLEDCVTRVIADVARGNSR